MQDQRLVRMLRRRLAIATLLAFGVATSACDGKLDRLYNPNPCNPEQELCPGPITPGPTQQAPRP